MKATITILAAVLTLQAGILFAGNDFPPLTPNNDASASCCVLLVPCTPLEATFEDDATFDLNQLMPVTPTEASFDDMSSEMTSFANLAPVTPVVADFEDASDVITVDNGILAPTTPAEANFE